MTLHVLPPEKHAARSAAHLAAPGRAGRRWVNALLALAVVATLAALPSCPELGPHLVEFLSR